MAWIMKLVMMDVTRMMRNNFFFSLLGTIDYHAKTTSAKCDFTYFCLFKLNLSRQFWIFLMVKNLIWNKNEWWIHIIVGLFSKINLNGKKLNNGISKLDWLHNMWKEKWIFNVLCSRQACTSASTSDHCLLSKAFYVYHKKLHLEREKDVKVIHSERMRERETERGS